MPTDQETTVAAQPIAFGDIKYSLGDIVGDSYELISVLGQGGMGVLFRARHIVLDQVYALKVIAPGELNETTWKRFEQEGQVLGQLDHPNIVKIFNMGIDKTGCPFYVMELIEGQNLAQYLEEHKTLSLEQFIDVFKQVATGLEQVHLKGFVHRDIKPSNLLLVQKDDKTTVKIVDFGIVRKNVTAPLLPTGAAEQGLTVAGEVFGSPLYMSPEQIEGGEIELTSDVYSLGCTMYESMSGHPPFSGANCFDTFMQHQNAEPEPIVRDDIRADVLQEVSHIIEKAMKKKPFQRFKSMKELARRVEALKAINASGGVSGLRGANVENTNFGAALNTTPEPVPEPPSTVRPMLVAGAVVVAIGAIAYMALRPAATPVTVPAPVAKKVELPTASKTTVAATAVNNPLVMPDINFSPKFINAKTPISSVVDKGGKKIRRFLFDQEMSIGQIEGHGLPKQEAMGTLETTDTMPVFFAADEAVKSFPQIYARFDNDAIGNLQVDSAIMPPRMSVLKNWKNLQTLSFKDSALKAPGYLKGLSALKSISTLTIDHSPYIAADLIDSGILQRLTCLRLFDVPHRELLPELVKNKKLFKLALRRAELTPADWALLTKLKIVDIDLAGVALDKKAFADIARLSNLTVLSLANAQYKPQDLALLSKCKHLKVLKIDGRADYKDAYAQLHKTMPGLTLVK